MLNNFKLLANSLLSSLKLHYEIANKLNINREELTIYKEITSIVEDIIEKVDSVRENQTTMAINYLRQFYQHFNNFYNNLPYRNREQNIIEQINKNIEIDRHKKIIENSLNNLRSQFEQLKFNLDFFIKLDFFSNNIVVIGANGSGKTSLANILKGHLGNNGIVISAQRILRIPNFNSIPNPSQTLNQLKQSQTQDKTAKSEQSYSILHNEFVIVLQHLLADNIAKEHEYVERARKYGTKGDKIPEPPLTNLEKTFQIWRELIGHRSIRTKDGINIVVETPERGTYPAIQMSDGEKVVLYLVAQVLQAPENGFIVIDEPEMHLHPEAQVVLAVVLSIAVNQGLRVLLTTHSPYILDTFNFLTWAHQIKHRMEETRKVDLKQKFMNLMESPPLTIPQEALLPPSIFSAYFFRSNGVIEDIKKVSYDALEVDINWETFSQVSDLLWHKLTLLGKLRDEVLEKEL